MTGNEQTHSKGSRMKVYLPHHEPSHDEGVEDSQEAVNGCWVKTRQKGELGSTDIQTKNLNFFFIQSKQICLEDTVSKIF